MTLLLFFQQLHMMRRNMPPSAFEGQMGQQQKIMLYMMPMMYIFAGASMPVGVLVYWMVSNLWTLAQQWIIIRNYPTPGTPAYIEWEERMIAKGKDPKEIERIRADKARKRPSSTSPQHGAQHGSDGSATVVRQDVNRQTVRADDDGKQVVQRQQVQRSSRAARKKNSSPTGAARDTPDAGRVQTRRTTMETDPNLADVAAEEPAAQGDRVDPLDNEGDIAADYLEELLEIADLDGDIDIYTEGDRALRLDRHRQRGARRARWRGAGRATGAHSARRHDRDRQAEPADVGCGRLPREAPN